MSMFEALIILAFIAVVAGVLLRLLGTVHDDIRDSGWRWTFLCWGCELATIPVIYFSALYIGWWTLAVGLVWTLIVGTVEVQRPRNR